MLIVSVLACIRIYSRYRRVRPLTREVLARDPYSVRGVRKLIDGCAFRIYGHWVKKGEQQNRAALFQNTAKIMLLGLEDFETWRVHVIPNHADFYLNICMFVTSDICLVAFLCLILRQGIWGPQCCLCASSRAAALHVKDKKVRFCVPYLPWFKWNLCQVNMFAVPVSRDSREDIAQSSDKTHHMQYTDYVYFRILLDNRCNRGDDVRFFNTAWLKWTLKHCEWFIWICSDLQMLQISTRECF